MSRWIAGGGSGGTAPPPLHARPARITSGGFNPLPDTAGAWAALSGFALPIPAAAGDWVEINADFLQATGGASFLDLAVKVGASLVRFSSSDTAVPAVEGRPGWYPASGFSPVSGSWGFTAASGDIDAGNVVFVLACKGNGTGRLFADPNYPFIWRALNLRATT